MSTRYFWIYLDLNGKPVSRCEIGSYAKAETERHAESLKAKRRYGGLEAWSTDNDSLPIGGNLDDYPIHVVYDAIKKHPSSFQLYRQTFYYPEEELNKIKERERQREQHSGMSFGCFELRLHEASEAPTPTLRHNNMQETKPTHKKLVGTNPRFIMCDGKE